MFPLNKYFNLFVCSKISQTSKKGEQIFENILKEGLIRQIVLMAGIVRQSFCKCPGLPMSSSLSRSRSSISSPATVKINHILIDIQRSVFRRGARFVCNLFITFSSIDIYKKQRTTLIPAQLCAGGEKGKNKTAEY
jgi:hypothetical protein